jgi:hypothetical protein
MKFYIVAALTVLLIVAGIASVFIYRHWDLGRYDEIIIDKAERYDLPPELLKAIVFHADPRENRAGLTGLPVEVFDAYQKAMMTRPYRFVCRHRKKPPHKKELFDERKRCPVCGTSYIEEFFLPEINIEIGAWYLAYLRSQVKGRINVESSNNLDLALFAYLFDWRTLMLETNDLSALFVTDVFAQNEIYAKVLSKRIKFQKQF